MALLICNECKKHVSDRAVVCPHCGTPGPSGQQRTACPECGQRVAPGIGACPHCGFPLTPPVGATTVYSAPMAHPDTTHRIALQEWERAREKSAAWTRAELADKRAELNRRTRRRVVRLVLGARPEMWNR